MPKVFTKSIFDNNNFTNSNCIVDSGIEYWGNGATLKHALFKNLTSELAGASLNFIMNRDSTSFLNNCAFVDCVGNSRGSSISCQGYLTILYISKSQFINNCCKNPPGDAFYTAAKRCNAKFIDCIFELYPNHTKNDLFACNENDGKVVVIP